MPACASTKAPLPTGLRPVDLPHKGGGKSRGTRGFTLIEVLVALAVVAVSLSAIGSLIAVTVRGARAVGGQLALVETARGVFVEESLGRYVVAVLRQTRGDQRLYLGASPRAGIALLRVAKARALAEGRDYAVPDDVKAVAAAVLAHRLILAPEARSAALDAEDLVADALDRTPVPV